MPTLYEFCFEHCPAFAFLSCKLNCWGPEHLIISLTDLPLCLNALNTLEMPKETTPTAKIQRPL